MLELILEMLLRIDLKKLDWAEFYVEDLVNPQNEF